MFDRLTALLGSAGVDVSTDELLDVLWLAVARGAAEPEDGPPPERPHGAAPRLRPAGRGGGRPRPRRGPRRAGPAAGEPLRGAAAGAVRARGVRRPRASVTFRRSARSTGAAIPASTRPGDEAAAPYGGLPHGARPRRARDGRPDGRDRTARARSAAPARTLALGGPRHRRRAVDGAVAAAGRRGEGPAPGAGDLPGHPYVHDGQR